MEIYIESFIIQNILINFCLLKMIYFTIKNKTSFFKLLLASLVGTIPSVFIICFLNSTLILNITKFITAGTMLGIAFKQSKKQFVFSFILLFLYTYTFGGLITSLNSNVYYTSFGAVMTSKFSLEVICLIFIMFSYIFELVLKNIKLKISTSNLIYNLTLTQANNRIKINAYMDTGNFLNINGQPVLILDLNTYLKLTKTNLLNFLTIKTNTISTETVNGNRDLKTFNIDKIEIKNGKKVTILNNQIVAINTTNCFKDTNYQALLSPLFLN